MTDFAAMTSYAQQCIQAGYGPTPPKPAASAAPEVQPSLDGIADLSELTYHSFYDRIAAPAFRHDEATIRRLFREIMRNGQISPAELDALQELARTDVSHVQLKISSGTFRVPVADAAGREVLKLAANYKVDMNALWDSGADGRRTLYRMHGLSPSHKNHIERFIASKLQEGWKASNINNQYEPLRTMLGQLNHQIDTEMPDMKVEGRKILRESAELLDAYHKDAVPDYVYNWL